MESYFLSRVIFDLPTRLVIVDQTNRDRSFATTRAHKRRGPRVVLISYQVNASINESVRHLFDHFRAPRPSVRHLGSRPHRPPNEAAITLNVGRENSSQSTLRFDGLGQGAPRCLRFLCAYLDTLGVIGSTTRS